MQTEGESTNIQPTPGPPAVASEPLSAAIAATAPGQLRVIKRNGTVVPYTDDKIAVALTKAFLAVEGGTAAASPRIRELVAQLTEQDISILRGPLIVEGEVRWLYFADPDNNVIEYVQWLRQD